jgi:putative hemolysin
MDADEFDRVGEHLIITDEASGKVVGTYRMHTGDTAVRSGLGFYGARGSISNRMNPSANR